MKATTKAGEDPRTTAGRELPAHADIAIIGAGFSGLGMAVNLTQRGFDDFVVVERGTDVGGTWHFNTYPGCACDVPSHLYSFSFHQKPDWERTYSLQPQIRTYLRSTAEEFDLYPRIRFETTVDGARWDEGAMCWRIETSAGEMTARVLIGAWGPLFEPKLPAVPGAESFEGETFHSARWDHDFDPRGKRIAAIGTGASAIQFVPEIAPEAEQLYVFQRTPPWVLPHTARATSRFERKLYARLPRLQEALRAGVYSARELLVLGFVKFPPAMKLVGRLALRHQRSQIDDPELREKVRPDYDIGCKRILPSNEWYPALGRDNVELVTEGVAEIKPRSIVADDGTEVEVDAIIYGTGFHVTDPPASRTIIGRGGRSLAQHWGETMAAHAGSTVPEFPNLFMVIGPNTGLGHSSMVYMIESHVNYIVGALEQMSRRDAGVVEVTEQAYREFIAEIDRKMEGTIWSSGCDSWYTDASGRNSTLWPDWTWKFRRRTRDFDSDAYSFAPGPPPEPSGADERDEVAV